MNVIKEGERHILTITFEICEDGVYLLSSPILGEFRTGFLSTADAVFRDWRTQLQKHMNEIIKERTK